MSPGMRGRLLSFAIVAAATASTASVLAADSLDADHAAKMTKGVQLFTDHVRPVLLAKCFKCHGGETVESSFDITDRDRLLKGGDDGVAVLPGKSRASLLYRLVSHQKKPHMPYEQDKLPDAAIEQIGQWIDLGAPYDRPLKRAAETPWTKKVISPEARKFWSFQPLSNVAPPPVKRVDWPRTPVDQFVLAKMEAAGVAPNAPANKRQLIRRVYLDLTGLPPSPEEIEAFEKDAAPSAYEKVVDRLLASAHFGERWARRWLDISRFAESHGFEHDYDRPTAYPFRDFVIRAINDDLPFDTFVKWQLAGDEYAPDNAEANAATGFLAAGVHSTQITKNEVERQRYDELDDMVATMGTGMLGLTIGCCRCHDHKYDPLPQRDYYRLLSAFTTTVRSEAELDIDPANKKKQKTLVASEGLTPIRLHTQGVDFFNETYFLNRGDVNQRAGVASLGFPQVLDMAPDGDKHWIQSPPKGWRTSYRRRSVAEWITDPKYGGGALLARVAVNRLWQGHFGRGIVATTSDFGNRGERPTHPELLDWLAGELIRGGWRLKPLHKQMVMSAAYIESCEANEADAKLDPDNHLVWRHPTQRLEAEVIRDSLLSVSGTLDATMYGPGTLDTASRRRSIYFTVKRSQLIPMMTVFDGPDALNGIGQRSTTTVAPQALYLMNNPQVREYAKALAARVAPKPDTPLDAAVRSAYLHCLGRPPAADETADSLVFIQQQIESYKTAGKSNARELGLADFCQTVLCLNEFVYVE